MTRNRAAKSPRSHVGLEQRFVAAARDLPKEAGSGIVVGFSGGPDSLALALLLERTKRITGMDPLLVHVDHGLRPESSAEAQHARALAEAIDLPFTPVKLRKGLPARHAGVGVEEAARRERYEELALQAAARNSKVVATAHHRWDQAETVLLHLVRGAGIAGAGGMDQDGLMAIPWWPSTIPPRNYRVWRPLLHEDPNELAAYCEASGLEPNLDVSNFDETNPRNAIRHQILPALEVIQPDAVKAIARFASIASAENSLVTQLTNQARAEIAVGEMRLDRKRLDTAGVALARRLIQHQAEIMCGEVISFERVEQIRELTHLEPTDRIIQITGDCIAVSDHQWIYVGSLAAVWKELADAHLLRLAPPFWDITNVLPVEPGKLTRGGGISVRVAASEQDLRGVPYVEIPSAAFDGQVVLHTIRQGDRWARSGIQLNEWLRQKAVPPIARRRILVLSSSEGVWWVPLLERPEGDAPRPGERVFYVGIQ